MNGSWLRALLVQGKMSPRSVIVGHVGAKYSTEMSLVENNEVVETVSPNRPDEPLVHARVECVFGVRHLGIHSGLDSWRVTTGI